ncbi:hypothetical protein [Thalassotalea sp. PS06]|uniref:hypothetical protein n=1 Tax=Thalassotalea sp. PS06 TaxID=2594005 RepID=UPI001163076D|nr:hypothetical protein [Thalassotalea sp. PS06]QDP02452.1 hypothetical protein FNC98_14510 [Thalassotalea sp. PS06]
MKIVFKNNIKNVLIRGYRQYLRFSSKPFNQLLNQALLTAEGKCSQEDIRKELADFYQKFDDAALKQLINFSHNKKVLGDNYKMDLFDITQYRIGFFNNIQKRFIKLVRHKNIRLDIVRLNKYAQIPPYMHSGVVSGFYVLEGKVAIRHYDQVSLSRESARIKKSIDTTLTAGSFTTNSEYKDNIHWLNSLADETYLVRFNVTHIPNARFPLNSDNPRTFINPVNEHSEGEYDAKLIDEKAAKSLSF